LTSTKNPFKKRSFLKKGWGDKMIRQALPTYGVGLLTKLDKHTYEHSVVFCAPEAWELVRSQFPIQPLQVVDRFSMEQSELEALISDMPKATTVFGIGGGSACDAAKMYAWTNAVKLVLVPTILSVDAPYTPAVGVRVGHHVRYVGQIYPEHLLVDFDIIRQSPCRLNRAGIGDVLSIHTALYDWKLAATQVGEAYQAEIAEQSARLFERLERGADDIYRCNDNGLKLISDLYVDEVRLCEEHGNSRPEEGSEHYIAYCLESLTHTHYLHGELIALCTLLGSIYQGQNSDRLFDVIRKSGVAYRPEEVGTTLEELERTLLALPEYLSKETQLPYGIFHHRPPTRKNVQALLETFEKYLAT
jgi:glycerol-1-phosphate dehydrogenase [NAD(P)+]